MNLSTYKNIYFLGIGGIGMSSIARWFHQQGFYVGGYDKTETELTKTLVAEGIQVHYDNQVGRIPTEFYAKVATLVVYTPAIPTDNSEFLYFQNETYTMMKRSQVLGFLTSEMKTIAVAGTHGKTTTSSMIAHLLKVGGINVNAFLGGITTNYNSNLLIGEKNGIAVVEADEFDRSFLTLYPSIAVITSTDADHLDIYGEAEELKRTFSIFASQIKDGGTLYLKEGLEVTKPAQVALRSYAYDGTSICAKNLSLSSGKFVFDYIDGDIRIEKIAMQMPGFHNVENALAAISIALSFGISESMVKKGIETFLGVKRRFQYILNTDKIVFIDDYAHHPTEIENFLRSVKELYAGKKVTCVFQPHLFSRTRDFMDGFAKSLALADQLFLLEIYPAREKPIDGVTSGVLFEQISGTSKCLVTKETLMEQLKNENPEVLVTVGAGDIDTFVTPIKEWLMQKHSIAND